ncbi:MAG: hypothetical protein J6A53_02630 [Clostridia bacterium]|nr:hypothetical protein [Clostridia bacterium]
METVKFKIIDGRHINIGCSFEDYVNTVIEKLPEETPGLVSFKLVHISPDYFVFQLKIKEIEEDVPP